MKMNQDIFAKRRKKLLKELGKGVAILKSPPSQTRSNDTEYNYRIDSDIYYLTGYKNAGSAFIINPNDKENVYTMFVLPKDPERETWVGRRLTFDQNIEKYGANKCLSIDDFEKAATEAMKTADTIYINMNHDTSNRHKMMDMFQNVKNIVQREGDGPLRIEALSSITSEMRLIKDAVEIEAIQKASDISAEAHVLAMKNCKPGKSEYQLQGIMEGYFLQNGCKSVAYGSIVGGGENATVLHYENNDSEIKNNDLILIDAACEYDMYASDITRTFPANGKFTDVQRALYQVVLDAQNATIAACKPGITFEELHAIDLKILVEGMVGVGLLKGKVKDIIKDETYKPYFMHKTGHWMGLDVHDVGNYKKKGKSRPLEEGMVFTVEPGIYVSRETDAPNKYKGIGIRIEDNILITKEGHHNFTRLVPKEINDIEMLMGESK